MHPSTLLTLWGQPCFLSFFVDDVIFLSGRLCSYLSVWMFCFHRNVCKGVWAGFIVPSSTGFSVRTMIAVCLLPSWNHWAIVSSSHLSFFPSMTLYSSVHDAHIPFMSLALTPSHPAQYLCFIWPWPQNQFIVCFALYCIVCIFILKYSDFHCLWEHLICLGCQHSASSLWAFLPCLF